jgi:Dihaem cytochrome c
MMSSPIARDRMIRIVLLIVLSLGLKTEAAMAAGSSVPVGAEKETLKECSSCHMAYPPEMLPMRSWRKIVGDLANHFGESAALPEPARADIEAYLMANAGDTPGAPDGPVFVSDIPADVTPLRVTDTPYWNRLHGEIPASDFASSQVKSKANCVACHIMADQGQYGE